MCWLGKEERVETEPNAELRVIDRAFLHGDIVGRASDALGQTGRVASQCQCPSLLGAQLERLHSFVHTTSPPPPPVFSPTLHDLKSTSEVPEQGR